MAELTREVSRELTLVSYTGLGAYFMREHPPYTKVSEDVVVAVAMAVRGVIHRRIRGRGSITSFIGCIFVWKREEVEETCVLLTVEVGRLTKYYLKSKVGVFWGLGRKMEK